MSKKLQYTVFHDDEEVSWSVETTADGQYRVQTPDGRVFDIDAYSPADGQLHLLCDQRSVDVDLVEIPAGIQLQIKGERHIVEVLNDRERRMRATGRGAAAGKGPDLLSPMAGKVVKIVAEPGQLVEAGDPLVVVEAMKMENDLKAHRDGVVASVGVENGHTVEIGDVLVTIEDHEE